MSDLLIPFGGAWLALTPEQYQTALARGRALVACRAQHRLYALLDTYPAEKLNKPAYLVDPQGIAKNRKNRVPYSAAWKQAICPSGSHLKEAAHGR